MKLESYILRMLEARLHQEESASLRAWIKGKGISLQITSHDKLFHWACRVSSVDFFFLHACGELSSSTMSSAAQRVVRVAFLLLATMLRWTSLLSSLSIAIWKPCAWGGRGNCVYYLEWHGTNLVKLRERWQTIKSAWQVRIKINISQYLLGPEAIINLAAIGLYISTKR